MSSTAISAQGSAFSIGTGTGGAKTITAVAVGFPTILTATAHGFANGDRVTIADMTGGDAGELNGKEYTVKYKETNTFAVDQDTTGKTITVTAGSATPITFTAIDNIKTINGMDGSASEIDRTNLASTAKEFILGLTDPGQITLELDHDLNDAGQIALFSHQQSGVMASFKLVLPNADTFTFNGYVKKFGMTAGVDQAVKRQVDIRITGAITKTP